MTARAKLVGCLGLANHQRLIGRMHLVAGCAGSLIPGVAAFQAPDLRGLIQVTGETNLVDRRGRELRWIADVISGGSLCVGLTRTVAGLARPAHPSFLGVDL